jgi:hypothetical protein
MDPSRPDLSVSPFDSFSFDQDEDLHEIIEQSHGYPKREPETLTDTSFFNGNL